MNGDDATTQTSAHRLYRVADNMERVLALTENLTVFPGEARRLVREASAVTAQEAQRAAAAAEHPIGLVGLRKLICDVARDDGGDDEAYTYDIDDETCERIALAVLARFGVTA